MSVLRARLKQAVTLEQGSAGDRFEARLTLAPDFPGFTGHFPGDPVLPGVCLVQAVLAACDRFMGAETRLVLLKTARFRSPVRPGDALHLRVTLEPGAAHRLVDAAIRSGQRRVARITLEMAVDGGPGASAEQGG